MAEHEFLKRVRAAQRARGLAQTPLMASEKEPTTAQLVGKAIAAGILLAFYGWILYWAYNELRPLFHGPPITYWQALAIAWVLGKVRQFLKG
jgi:hypothetical protein